MTSNLEHNKDQNILIFTFSFLFLLHESFTMAPRHAIGDPFEWEVRVLQPYFSPMTGRPGEALNPSTCKILN